MKSSDHRWFGPCGIAMGIRAPTARLRPPRLRTVNHPKKKEPSNTRETPVTPHGFKQKANRITRYNNTVL
ncbi:hypothetical protein KBY27_22765, partial [Ruegeria pomeroyi]|nr:hypothetical protein [Ruegeria pomeroyi]